MNANPIIPGPPGRPAERLHARRCARHSAREAVARCPSCSGFFCRECIVEHDGQLICAPCLARSLKPARPESRARLAPLKQLCLCAASVVLLWICFYTLGTILLRIPPGFHDGTVWHRSGTDPAE